MGRYVAVAIGPSLALFVSIALIETDTAGARAMWLGALVGGVATFLSVPPRYRANGGAIGLGVVSLALGFVIALFGTLIWLFQFIPPPD